MTTKTAQIIATLFKAARPMRTRDLADATGVPAKNITALLAAAVKKGDVSVCKVSIPGQDAQNEYRIGSGVPVPEFKPLNTGRRVQFSTRATGNGVPPLVPKPAPKRDPIVHPFLATGQTSENAASASAQPEVATKHRQTAIDLSNDNSSVEAQSVAKTPAPTPAHAVNARGNDIRIQIDDDATLTIGVDGTVIELKAHQVLALGDFLHVTNLLWRP